MQTFFQNLLTASFHGSVVILAVLVLRLVLKRAPRKFFCLLWLMAGLRLLLPFEIKSQLSLQPDLPSTQTVYPIRTQEVFLPDMDEPMYTLPAETSTQMTAPRTPQTADQPEVVPPVTVPEKNPFSLPDILPYLWLTVACCFGVYTLAAYGKLKRRVRFAVRIPGGWECDNIDTAFILGFIRPQIYIPMGMDPAYRRHILAHERTHLEKGDHWFKMVGYIALALHWFNPLVWVAYILLCKDIEMACDERVVRFMELEERKEYSQALLKCSTNRAHLAACPVAFGEVSVKTRIRSVLNYRKPGFWISLLGMAAVVFVAICLVTSPEDGEQPQAAAVETRPAADAHFTDTLTEETAVDGAAGIRELKAQDSYCIQIWQQDQDEEQAQGYTTTFRRAGGNKLVEARGNGDAVLSGALWYGGGYAAHMGDALCWVENVDLTDVDLDAWLDAYAPTGKEITRVSIADGGSVAFHGTYTNERYGEEKHDVDWCVGFQSDGAIAYIEIVDRETFIGPDNEESGGISRRILTPLEETFRDTTVAIESAAADTMTSAELTAYRVKQDQVTEVPSNRTSYDKDFMLGSGQMGWQFAQGEWFFKFGAEDVTATGLELVVEASTPYGNNTISGGVMEAGTEYFLEELVDGVWTTLPAGAADRSIPAKKLPGGGTQVIDWSESYGALPGGFYRIGNYYTFTATDGTRDTQVCYAKFRIYDQDQRELLEECRNAVAELKNRDAFHIYATSLVEGSGVTMADEYWKAGGDYLSTGYTTAEDGTATDKSGAMWRNGKYYGLEWDGDPADAKVSSWWQGVDGYMDDSNFTLLWETDYSWYDAEVELVFRSGDSVVIRSTCPYGDAYQCEDIILTFDPAGKLVSMEKQQLPQRNSAQKDKRTINTLVVLDDDGEQIRSFLDAQDVTTPMPFPYEPERVAAMADASTGGFRNTTAKAITSCAEAVARADRECSLPQILGFDNGYLQTRTYHDDSAGVWKVELFWWQHDTAQTVYLSDQGLTLAVVTVE